MEKFDKLIWRINGILICGAVVCVVVFAVFAGGYAAYEAVGFDDREREVSDIVVVDEENKKEISLVVENFNRVAGTPYYVAAVNGDERFDRGSYSKFSHSIKNYFFFNSEDGSSYYLFPDHERLICDRDVLIRKINELESEVLGWLYEVVDVDSNVDGLLTHSDYKKICISDASGKTVTSLVDEVVRTLGFQKLKGNQICFFAQTAHGYFAYIIDIDRKEVIEKTALNTKENGGE